MLSSYGKREWLTILLGGAMLTITALVIQQWLLAALLVAIVVALLSFFRDPKRGTPTQRNVMVAPSDGTVSSVHEVEYFQPFEGPAQCVRIFMSLLDVHVNTSPCHGEVVSITHKPGKYLNAMNPESAEVNECNLIVFHHPTRKAPVAAVRQVAGMIARRIVCDLKVGDILQRGQRFGMIKFGSTTELYVPMSNRPTVLVEKGDKVKAGETILLKILPAGELIEGEAEDQDNADPQRREDNNEQTQESPADEEVTAG